MLEQLQESENVYARMRETKVSLLDIVLIFARGKWIWIGCAVVCGSVALIVANLLPVQYRAETDILPPAQPASSASMLMGEVGAALGMGGGSSLSVKDPNNEFIAILQSRTVADALITRFDLQKAYSRPDIVLAEIALAKHSRINTTLQGTISVQVEDRDPKRAAAIANGYIDELYNQNERLSFAEAAQRRHFYQVQLEREKNALEDAEVALKETQLKTGVLELQGQTEMTLRSAADFRAQITYSELQLQNLLTSETENNPEVIRLKRQIGVLQSDLEKVQSDNSKKRSTDETGLTTATVPGLAVEYIRKLREVKYHEALFDLLTRQYEAAKLDQAREAPVVQVIDSAVPPHFKSWPRPTMITAAGIAIGIILGLIYTIAAEMVRRALREPEYALKWSEIRKAIWG